MSDVAPLRTAALAYAAAGLRVFPVLANRKEPATAHGVKDATTDAAQIEAWWSVTPYLIGVACGPESGVFVVDVDPRGSEKENPRPWRGGQWASPVRTATARSGGRYALENYPNGVPGEGGYVQPGTHYWFKWPVGVAKMRPTLAPGVDVIGAGKYVIAPPSVTQEAYEWIDTAPLADAPAEVLAEVAIAEGAVTDQRPGDRFNEEQTWADVLGPYGWRVDHEDADGVAYWTRPGKDSGVSATTNYAGSDLFYVFSTSTEFEAQRGYDKFGAWAALEFGGDINAAALALAAARPRVTVRGVGFETTPLLAPPAQFATPALAGYAYQCPTPSDHLLTQYIYYAGMVTDAAAEYHEAACLALLSVLTAGMRVALAPFPGGLATNLYVALVGPSSVSRKSTAQAIARTFLGYLRPNALLPDRASGEMLISELAQRKLALWMPDELGAAVVEIYQRGGYLQAIEQVLLTMYGSRDYRYQTIGRGETAIVGLELSVLGAATPESFAGAGRGLTGGLLPRFGVVYPRGLPPSRPPVLLTDEHRQWREGLSFKMRQVLDMCSYPGSPRAVTMTQDALTALGGLDREFGSMPLTARLVTAAYKITALVALADLRLEATLADANAAIAITRRWADGAHNLRRFLGRLPADVQHMEQVAIARSELRQLPSSLGVDGRRVVPVRIFARRMALPASTLKRILATMESTGEVVIVLPQGGEEEVHFAG